MASNTSVPPPVQHRRAKTAIMLVCAFCASLLTATWPSLVVPHFASMYANFDVALPFVTRIVVEHPELFWMAPILTLLVWRLWPDRSRGALFALLFAIASLCVSAGLLIFALYLPIFQLAPAAG